jgi:hypothetical protein
LLRRNADHADPKIDGTRITRITQIDGTLIARITKIQERRQPGVARLARRVTIGIGTPLDIEAC